MSHHDNLPTAFPSSVPGFAYGNDPGDEPSGPGLKRYRWALMRYKWLVLGVLVVGTVIGIFVSGRVPKSYVAEARIVFNKSNQGPMSSDDLLSGDAWLQLMAAWTVQDWVVMDRRLYIHHAETDNVFGTFKLLEGQFFPGKYVLVVRGDKVAELRLENGQIAEQVKVGEPIGKRLGWDWVPPKRFLTPKREIPFEVMIYRDAAKKLADNLTVKMPNPSFMTVSLKGKDPDETANIVNAMADRFLFVATEIKKSQLVQRRDVLERQLRESEDLLRQSEAALFHFQVQNMTSPSGAASAVTTGSAAEAPIMTQYMELQTARGALAQERESIQLALTKAASDSLSVDALTGVAAVARAPELSKELTTLATLRSSRRQLLQHFTADQDEVKRVQAQIDELQRTIIPSLGQAVIADLDAKAAQLDVVLQRTGKDLLEIPGRSISQQGLERNVALAASMHNSLRQNYEEVRVEAETAIPDVQILDRAQLRGAASSNPRLRLTGLAVLISLALGVVLAIVLDQMDPRIRYAEQVSHDLRLSIVGVVPNLIARRSNLLAADDSAKVVEALRGIRLNIMHAFGSAGPLTLTISSPGSGDGKTFITSNLALAFADLGMRTLIIDGDTRRGELHRLYDATRKPGLTDYLGGSAPIEAVLRTTRFPLVNIIPAGTRRPDAPELLSSPRMGDLLAHIRSQYQVILIDSPPLGAGVDPLVLATLTGHMVLVMRTGKTDRTLAGAKMEMLDRLPIRVIGAIINGLDTSDAYRYYSYLPGYEAGNEEGEPDSSDEETVLLEPVGSGD